MPRKCGKAAICEIDSRSNGIEIEGTRGSTPKAYNRLILLFAGSVCKEGESAQKVSKSEFKSFAISVAAGASKKSSQGFAGLLKPAPCHLVAKPLPSSRPAPYDRNTNIVRVHKFKLFCAIPVLY